jgi:predicted DNA-binding transcriptional regulator YafY
VIEPLYTTERGGASYLIAYCRLRHDQRTFRLDRILSAELFRD